MGKGKKKQEAPPGAPLWMCTFSDMMSLLLCFFVLLFAMSTIEKVKYVQTIGAIKGSFGKVPNLFNMSFVKPLTIIPQDVKPSQREKTIERAREAIAQKARSKLVADEASKEVIVEGVKEGVRISLTGNVLFETGSAILTEGGKEMLSRVQEFLADFPEQRIRVEGHTDNSYVPPNSIYSNNWKLAAARAMAVMYFLRDNNHTPQQRSQWEKQLSFMSCGEYRPRFPNDTPENQALNRRVEIILLQGEKSMVVPGVLEGTGDVKVNPDASDFVPGIR